MLIEISEELIPAPKQKELLQVKSRDGEKFDQKMTKGYVHLGRMNQLNPAKKLQVNPTDDQKLDQVITISPK